MTLGKDFLSPVFHARRQEYAGYVEQEARLFNGTDATGGFRVDGNSEFGKEVSPSWTVAIPLQYGLTLRGSYSEGFRAPSFNELFFPGFGNPKLNPELSSEYDGGITKTFGETVVHRDLFFTPRAQPDRGGAVRSIDEMPARCGQRRPRRYAGRRTGTVGPVDARARVQRHDRD